MRKILITAMLMYATSSFAFMTVMEDSIAVTTKEFQKPSVNIKSLNYIISESEYQSKFTEAYTKLFYAYLSKSFGKTDTINDKSTVKIKIVIAEDLDKDVKELKKKVSADVGFLEGTEIGFKSFMESLKSNPNSDPITIVMSAFAGAILGTIGTDSEYVAVTEVEYRNQKTRVIAKTQRIGLSPSDAVETLSKISAAKVASLFQGGAK